MSIVNNNHPAGSETRGDGLWRTARPEGDVAPRPQGRDVTFRRTSGGHPCFDTPVGGDDSRWQSRLDGLVSSGLSDDASRRARINAAQAQSRAAFDDFQTLCRDELRPVLDTSRAMLSEWGIDARVSETLHDKPTRLPRSYDLALRIDQFGDRGPGKLTITASEAHQAVRVKISVGPSRLCGEVREHVGTTRSADLSDAMVGGLVATLVERIFST
jgi:hypothetical protein